ncbi:MAG: class I SAM-dependent methyltransferase [Polyangiales bacterium]
MTIAQPTPATPNFTEIKTRQQAMWASGDYAVVGTTLQPVGESLAEVAGVHAGQRVLDVACGNGNVALAAARRFADVTGLDYVPELLARAEARARAEGVNVTLVEGDAEAMPFTEARFDVVLSTFGVMFAPDHAKSAREMARVTVPGGKIGLANWTPEGFIGQLFKIIGKYVPPAPGLVSPIQWGNEAHLAKLFEGCARVVSAERKMFTFHYLSAEHFVEVFRRYYGPTHKAFLALDASKQAALADEMTALINQHDRGEKAMAVPSEYLEIVLQTEA